MSVTDQNGWGEVERMARLHESRKRVMERFDDILSHMTTVTIEDRLRGAIVESLSLLEQGHPTAAHQVLQDALKIGGVK